MSNDRKTTSRSGRQKLLSMDMSTKHTSRLLMFMCVWMFVVANKEKCTYIGYRGKKTGNYHHNNNNNNNSNSNNNNSNNSGGNGINSNNNKYNSHNNTTNNTAVECWDSYFCRKQIRLAHVDLPPYHTSKIFEQVVENCCGGPKCVTITNVHHYNNITQVKLSAVNMLDFILPLLGKFFKIPSFRMQKNPQKTSKISKGTLYNPQEILYLPWRTLKCPQESKNPQ